MNKCRFNPRLEYTDCKKGIKTAKAHFVFFVIDTMILQTENEI